jgi:hypothetical protein
MWKYTVAAEMNTAAENNFLNTTKAPNFDSALAQWAFIEI